MSEQPSPNKRALLPTPCLTNASTHRRTDAPTFQRTTPRPAPQGTLNRLSYLLCSRDPQKCEVPWISFLHGVCDPSQGTMNLLLTLSTDLTLQRELYAKYKRCVYNSKQIRAIRAIRAVLYTPHSPHAPHAPHAPPRLIPKDCGQADPTTRVVGADGRVFSWPFVCRRYVYAC